MSPIRTIYVEREIEGHPRVDAILRRWPSARVIECERYGEVFNPRAQSFRLQKAAPALVLAAKHDRHVLPAPPEYHIGGRYNFYFSHLLNCPYDCRYCFLQGMFRSAHYVLFVNYEDFQSAIDQRLKEVVEDRVYFFSGYDCDSLALEGVTRFCEDFLPYFASRPRAWLELRTKSASIKPLDTVSALDNCVVAFSFTPPTAHRRWESGVPTVERRLRAMSALGERGWRLGLRFDPLLWWPDCFEDYRGLFRQVFDRLRPEWLHSVSFGVFRLPASFLRRINDLYPEEELFAAPFERRGSMVSYRADLERELLGFCEAELRLHVAAERIFPCRVGVVADERSGSEPTSRPRLGGEEAGLLLE